jgi:anti-sigma B factor antagonist
LQEDVKAVGQVKRSATCRRPPSAALSATNEAGTVRQVDAPNEALPATACEVHMTFETEDRASIKIIRLHGELRGDELRGFVEHVTNLLTGPRSRIILDLGDVPFMNSTALGQFVRVVAQANVQESRVVLGGLSPFVEGVLSATRLNRFFEVYRTTDEALRKLVS